jgi:hypothetical protein
MSERIRFETELERVRTEKGGKRGSVCLFLNEAAHGLFIPIKRVKDK